MSTLYDRLIRLGAWAKAHVGLLVAAALALAVVVAVFVTTFRIYDDRRELSQEAVETDRAFCALANDSRGHINRNRQAIRALEAAVRQAFELVRPAPDADPEQRRRTDEFRDRILAGLDVVNVDGDLPLLDCSGIGNGKVDFSIQGAITGLTTSTSTPR